MTEYRRVVLSGFMGAGKTTVGGLVAQLLGWPFVDADHALVESAGVSIAELFALHGEEAFRQREAAVVQELLNRDGVVVALGGGALEWADTRDRLQTDRAALVVFLETPLEVSLARCLGEPGAAERPVLRDREALGKRFESRMHHYRSTAGLTLLTAGQAPRALAECIVAALKAPADRDLIKPTQATPR